MKKAFILLSFTLFISQTVQLNALKPLEKVKSVVTSPIAKIRNAARGLQTHMNCVYTNSCTPDQKKRIKKTMGILLAVLGITIVAGTAVYASRPDAKPDLVQEVLKKYGPLPTIEVRFLKKVHALGKTPNEVLSAAVNDIKIQSKFVSAKGLAAAIEILGGLNFKDKNILISFLENMKEVELGEELGEELRKKLIEADEKRAKEKESKSKGQIGRYQFQG